MTKISTGTKVIDELLEGGYENDIITTVYGPGGSGKTNLCILCAVDIARKGKKVIYIDTEGSFSILRLKQIAPDYEDILKNILFFKPTSFKGQKAAFSRLRKITDRRIGLIIVDTISMLYRLELGKNDEVYETNKELGLQIGYLTEISRKKNIPILITNQVYSNFDEKDKVNMVGGDILKYGSKCLIEIQKTPSGKRTAILRKHRSQKEEKDITFEIVEKGIIKSKESGFKIF